MRAIEVEVGAPPGRVWQALREPEELRRWFGWDYDGLEAEIREIFLDGARVAGEGEALEVSGGDRFELEGSGTGTLVRVIRATDPELDPDAYDAISEGWLGFLWQLGFALERHPGEERATVRMSGAARDESTHSPLAPLGLRELAGLELGAGFELDSAPSGLLTGRVRHRSQRQIALEARELGDGLAVLAQSPPSGSEPFGAASVVLSLYGGAIAEREPIERTWNEAWRQGFEA